jgi:hypothetical protein
MSLVLSRRSCRVCQFMVFNISDTLLVLWCLLHVYLAARRCTFSSELMFSFAWGSQTVQQYTNLGLIRVWYARSFIVCDCTFRFLLKKHNDLFALAAVCWMWVLTVIILKFLGVPVPHVLVSVNRKVKYSYSFYNTWLADFPIDRNG